MGNDVGYDASVAA